MSEIEDRLKKLPRLELEYFRDWLMNHYPIYALAHDIDTIIDTMDGVGAEYDDIQNLLDTIAEHSKWEIDESLYLEEEKRGYYCMIESEILMDN